MHCSGLTSINIPNSVTTIGNYAFSNCSGLTSINIPNSVNSIGNSAFFNCSGLTSIKVESGNTKYDSRNNCNAIIETNTNTLIAGCNNAIIPNSVTTIGNSAFFNCSGLTSINIPNSVTTIGNYAFYKCTSLTSITIPNSVTTIGNRAFYGCRGLASVISEIKDPQQVSLGTNVFYNTDAILYVPAGTKSSYEAISGWKNSFSEIFEVGGGIAVDETNFPDDAFRSWVLNNIPGASDGVLTDEEIGNVRSINCSGTYESRGNIHDMKGIECFTNLRELNCSYNQLTALDVTKNTALTKLECHNNLLTALDVTKNTNLGYLKCDNNQLLNLNLSNNNSLSNSYFGGQYLSDQILSLTAVDITAGIAIPVPSEFNFSKVSNMKLAGVSVTGKTTTVNSQKYLVFAATGTAQSSINGKLLHYEYDTDNSAAGKMAVDVTLSYTAPGNPVTITANSYTITYGDPLPTFGYTTTGSALVGTPIITCSATSNSNAGTYDIIVSEGSVSNSSITLVKGTLTIKKATLRASVGSYTKKQGDAMPSFSISYLGFKNGETKSVLTREPTVLCSATASSAPGSYPITLSGGQAINYEFNYQNGMLTVIAADAAAVTARSYTITYGDPLPQFAYETSGAALNGTPAISCAATANSDAGTYDIVVSKGSVSNYNVSYVNGTLTIEKAVLTASVGEYTKKPGEDNPKFIISYSGFKKNQTKSVLTSEPTARCEATKDSPSGTYPITLSGG